MKYISRLSLKMLAILWRREELNLIAVVVKCHVRFFRLVIRKITTALRRRTNNYAPQFLNVKLRLNSCCSSLIPLLNYCDGFIVTAASIQTIWFTSATPFATVSIKSVLPYYATDASDYYELTFWKILQWGISQCQLRHNNSKNVLSRRETFGV